jgi:hypothetical protein
MVPGIQWEKKWGRYLEALEGASLIRARYLEALEA